MADLTDEQLAEIERDWEHVVATGGAVKLAECDTCAAAYDAFPVLLRALRDARAEAWQHARICTAHAAKVAAERDALRAENVVLRQRIEDMLNDFADQTMYGEGCVTHAKLRALLAAPTGQEEPSNG